MPHDTGIHRYRPNEWALYRFDPVPPEVRGPGMSPGLGAEPRGRDLASPWLAPALLS